MACPAVLVIHWTGSRHYFTALVLRGERALVVETSAESVGQDAQPGPYRGLVVSRGRDPARCRDRNAVKGSVVIRNNTGAVGPAGGLLRTARASGTSRASRFASDHAICLLMRLRSVRQAPPRGRRPPREVIARKRQGSCRTRPVASRGPCAGLPARESRPP